MAVRLTNAAQDAANDAVVDQLDAGGAGTLAIYSGTQPADADDGIGGATLLGTLTFSVPAYAASTGGSAAANSITQDSSADATGTAAWFRARSGAGTTIFDGSVGTSGADLNLNTVDIVVGGPIEVTSLNFAFPASA